MKRNISGIFFKVKDEDNIYHNVCFEECTIEQQEEILHKLSERKIKGLCIAMANNLRKISERYNINGGY